ncbi:hypothetical protein [Anaerosporobacter sp.]
MNWNKIIKDNKLLPDLINIVLGIAVIVLFVLVILKPSNYALMASLMIVAGIMNLSNGYRKARVNGQKGIGLFFSIVGVVVIAFGIYYLRVALA